jgi:hypothetical protein
VPGQKGARCYIELAMHTFSGHLPAVRSTPPAACADQPARQGRLAGASEAGRVVMPLGVQGSWQAHAAHRNAAPTAIRV